MNTYTDDKWKEFMAIDYEPINKDLLDACKVAEKLIRTARRYFPKSIRNSDKFDLENTGATISAAIHRAENEKDTAVDSMRSCLEEREKMISRLISEIVVKDRDIERLELIIYDLHNEVERLNKWKNLITRKEEEK